MVADVRSLSSFLGQGAAAPARNGAIARTREHGLAIRLLRMAFAPQVLALADQAVVSGSQFLTTVMIARWAAPSELGIYAIGYSLLASLITIQESLIALPYTIQRHRPIGTPGEHAGCALVQSGLLSTLVLGVLTTTAVALAVGGAGVAWASVAWTLAAVLPFRLLREFSRQFAFAHLRMANALMLDLAVAILQIGTLSGLALTGQMSAVTALLALGAASAPIAVLGVYLGRSDFAIRLDRSAAAMRQGWRLGRWLFAGQITVWIQVSVANWVLAMVMGTAATGLYAACISIVGFASPVIAGFCNTITPKAVLAFRERGASALRRHAVQSSLVIGAGMAAFCILIMLVGEDVMHLFYHGPEYEGQGLILTVLALALTASFVGIPASNALASIERPKAIVLVGSIGAMLTVALVWCLTIQWGLIGAAYGFLCGNTAGALGRWIAFLRIVSQFCGEDSKNRDHSVSDGYPDTASVVQVLEKLMACPEQERWIISQMGEGSQAEIYSVRARDGKALWKAHRTLVVKLYKASLNLAPELVYAQYDASSRLHQTIDGRTKHGWTICAPEPVYVCESPLALVMTMVSGRTLTWYLETGENMTPDLLESAAHAVVAAMDARWSCGQVHGDLTLDNILCDTATKELSIIDADAHVNQLMSAGIPQTWNPGVRDLIDLLTDIGLSGDPASRQRKRFFIESIILAFLEIFDSVAEKRKRLDEIDACSRAFLQDYCRSWSVRELWHRVLRQVILRRTDIMLKRMMDGLSVTQGLTKPATTTIDCAQLASSGALQLIRSHVVPLQVGDE